MRRQERLFLDFRSWGYDVKGWAKTTRLKYLERVRTADKWLRDNRGTSIFWASVDDIRAYLFSCSSTARNRNHVRCALIGFDDFLVDMEVIPVNRCQGLPRLPEPKTVPKPLTRDEAERLIRASIVFGPKWKTMVLTFLYTGFRRANVRLLKWTEISRDFNWITVVVKGRGPGKELQVPVHEVLRDALIAWKAQCPDPVWVFPSSKINGQPMSEGHLSNNIRAIGDFAGLEIHPHKLRHTFGTRFLEQTGNLRTTQEAMGHADPKSTVIYTLVRSQKLETAFGKLDFGR